jgi:hypothetical protein
MFVPHSFCMVTEAQKKTIWEAQEVIKTSLDLLYQQGKIGSWGYGTRSYEQGQWDPKKKRTKTEYIKAVFRLKALGDKHHFKFGFQHLCWVQNPANTHRVVLLDKHYKSNMPYFHYTEIVNYDDFMQELDLLARIIDQLDLRKFPETTPMQALKN